MTVKPLPQKNLIEDFVLKGSMVKEDVKEVEDKIVAIKLRLPESLLQRIDQKWKKQIGLNRTAWILGVIQKSLEE